MIKKARSDRLICQDVPFCDIYSKFMWNYSNRMLYNKVKVEYKGYKCVSNISL